MIKAPACRKFIISWETETGLLRVGGLRLLQHGAPYTSCSCRCISDHFWDVRKIIGSLWAKLAGQLSLVAEKISFFVSPQRLFSFLFPACSSPWPPRQQWWPQRWRGGRGAKNSNIGVQRGPQQRQGKEYTFCGFALSLSSLSVLNSS